VAEAQSRLRDYFPDYGSRGSLTDAPAETPRTALLEQYGSIVEPYEPSLSERIYNFAFDALGGNTATGLDRQRIQRRARYPQMAIDQTGLAALTDYSQAMQDYARGDALSGTTNMAMAAASLIPGPQKQAVEEIANRLSKGTFGKTLKADDVFSLTDRNAAGMTPNMVDYQTAGILDRNPNYFRESKDVDYEIMRMSPDEYLERGAAILRPEGKTTQYVIDDRAKESGYIDNMAASMQGGQVYAAPYLDYGSGGRDASQEGMHRALAAKQLGMEEIPVMVLDSYKNPKSPYRSALNEMDTPAQGQSALRTITGSQQIDAMAKNLNVPMIDRMLQPTGPVNRDMSLLERVGDVDRVNSMVVDELPGTLQPIPMVRAEDILNRPYVSTIVDTSDSSLGRIQAVNGIPVNDAVQYGGVYYGFQPENMDAGAIFANETVGATTTMLNKAKKAKDLPGAVGEPIFVPGGMMGKSIDYATMVPTLQIPYTSAVLSKKNKDLLDARIKRGKKNKKGEYIGGVPNWPGIDSPEALPFIGTIGGQRKNISTAIDEFASDGAMSLSEARAIVTDPSQFTPLAGDLRAAYEIDMSRNPAVTKRHPAYGVDIYGRPLGAFGEGFNIFSMNPLYKEGVNFLDSQRAMGRTITPTYTKEVNPKTILGGLYGTFDQETVDAMVKSGFVAP